MQETVVLITAELNLAGNALISSMRRAIAIDVETPNGRRGRNVTTGVKIQMGVFLTVKLHLIINVMLVTS